MQMLRRIGRWYHKNMDPLTYLHLQMRLEGKGLVNEHLIRRTAALVRQVEVVPDEKLPLMLIAHLASQEMVVYYDEAIVPDLQKELAASIHNIEFPKVDPLFNVLKSYKVKF